MKPLKDYINEVYVSAGDLKKKNITGVEKDLRSITQHDIDAITDKEWELGHGTTNEIYIPRTNVELWISMGNKRDKTWDIESFNSAYTKDGGYWCAITHGFATYEDAVNYIKTQFVDDIKHGRIPMEFEYMDF
jgi:hypothetical protein